MSDWIKRSDVEGILKRVDKPGYHGAVGTDQAQAAILDLEGIDLSERDRLWREYAQLRWAEALLDDMGSEEERRENDAKLAELRAALVAHGADVDGAE